jgi:hypothetical protein
VKFSKSFVTTFFPVDNDVRAVGADWVAHLRAEKIGGWTTRYFLRPRSEGPEFPIRRGGPGSLEQRWTDRGYLRRTEMTLGHHLAALKT